MLGWKDTAATTGPPGGVVADGPTALAEAAQGNAGARACMAY